MELAIVMGRSGRGGGGGKNQSCYLQVLGLGCDTLDTIPSVLLFFDKERYLFNIGEGFQKFSLEHKIKMAKIDAIFLTRTTTEAAGGLPGTLLTMADKLHGDHDVAGGTQQRSFGEGKPRETALGLYGPKGMRDFTNCLRTYVNIKDVKLEVSEIGEGGGIREPEGGARKEGALGGVDRHVLVRNDAVQISSVVLEVESGEAGDRADKRARLDGEASAGGSDRGSVDRQVAVSVYLLELGDIPGKFLPQKAAELGVPKGPAFGKLCRGESVMSTYGNYVAPEDVMEPATPGPIAVILDLPTLDHLRCLEAKGLVAALAEEARTSPGKPIVFVHLSPADVLASSEFAALFSDLPSNSATRHVLVHHNGSEEQHIFSSATRLQTELHAIYPEFFPLHRRCDPRRPAEDSFESGAIKGTNLLKYHLRPLSRLGLDNSEAEEAAARRDKADEGAPTEEDVARARDKLAGEVIRPHQVGKPVCVGGEGDTDLEVTFCGTGAAVPSKYRNLSGIYCRLAGRGGILLDGGEGVCGQLTRRYGGEKFLQVLADLKVVWVSHIHADHHSGLPSLLRMRSKVTSTPLVIVGPRQLRRVLNMYSKIEYVPTIFVDCAQTTAGSDAPEALSCRLSELGISLTSVPVIHSCHNAFGVVLEGKTCGWKLSFSGDTRPCEAFVRAAEGSTVLIHEATFENGLLQEALAKKHSLSSEAIEVGRRASAYRTILTHFSQRYPKIPVVDGTFTTSTCVAFDLMTFNLRTLEDLPKVVPEVAARYEVTERDPAEGKE